MGKGGGSSPPDPSTYQNNNAQMTEQMAGMVSGLGTSMMTMMEMMMQQNLEVPQLPEVDRTAEINWSEKDTELRQKMLADYTLQNQQRMGRQDTILSSPLLDNSSPETTESILAGKVK